LTKIALLVVAAFSVVLQFPNFLFPKMRVVSRNVFLVLLATGLVGIGAETIESNGDTNDRPSSFANTKKVASFGRNLKGSGGCNVRALGGEPTKELISSGCLPLGRNLKGSQRTAPTTLTRNLKGSKPGLDRQLKGSGGCAPGRALRDKVTGELHTSAGCPALVRDLKGSQRTAPTTVTRNLKGSAPTVLKRQLKGSGGCAPGRALRDEVTGELLTSGGCPTLVRDLKGSQRTAPTTVTRNLKGSKPSLDRQLKGNGGCSGRALRDEVTGEIIAGCAVNRNLKGSKDAVDARNLKMNKSGFTRNLKGSNGAVPVRALRDKLTG
jgi:hypothetical protein